MAILQQHAIGRKVSLGAPCVQPRTIQFHVRLPPGDVPKVLACQVLDAIEIDIVGYGLSLPASRRWIGMHNPGVLKGGKVAIKTGSRHVHAFHQPADGRWPSLCQVTQDIRLSPIAHMSDGHINLRGEWGHDQAWHVPILPEFLPTRASRFHSLLLSDRVISVNTPCQPRGEVT